MVEQREQSGLSDADVRGQLRAHLDALKDAGPGWEDPMVDAFLSRIESRLDQIVERRVQEGLRAQRGWHQRSTTRLAVCLSLAIPLLAIAGGFAGLNGVLVVMGAVLLLNWDQIIPI